MRQQRENSRSLPDRHGADRGDPLAAPRDHNSLAALDLSRSAAKDRLASVAVTVRVRIRLSDSDAVDERSLGGTVGGVRVGQQSSSGATIRFSHRTAYFFPSRRLSARTASSVRQPHVCHAPPVSTRALLLVGLGLLVLGLLVAPDLVDLQGIQGQSLLARGYISNVCSLLGVGLVLAASVISAVKKQMQPSSPPPPAIDHYS